MRSRFGLVAIAVLLGVGAILAATLLVSGGGAGGRAGESASRTGEVSQPGTPEVAATASSAVEEALAGRASPSERADSARTGVVRGRVTLKRSGEPVADAVVTLRTFKDEIDAPETVARLGGLDAFDAHRREGTLEDRVRALGGWKRIHRGTSGPDGAFGIAVPPGLPQFRLEVEADHAIFRDGGEWYALGTPEVEQGLTLELEPAGKVEGIVTDLAGKPLTGGRAATWSLPSGDERSADVGADGRFAIRGVRPGVHRLWALSHAHAPGARLEIEVRAGETIRADLALPPEGYVEGRVVDGSARGVAGALVQCQAAAADGVPLGALLYGRAFTDAEGKFRVGSLLAGRHNVRASKSGMVPGKWESVEIPAASGAPNLNLVLDPGLAVAGRVVDGGGRPVSNATVTVRSDDRAMRSRGLPRVRGSSQVGATAEDGSFRVGGLGEGVFVVEASARERGRAETRGVATDATGVEVVLDGGGSISGVVKEAETGEPVRRFRIFANRRNPAAGPRGVEGQGEHPFASKDGAFQLRERRLGTYDLVAVATGRLAEPRKGIEAVAAGTTGIEFRLRKGGTISGTVVERGSGAAIEGAAVTHERIEGDETAGEYDDWAIDADPSARDGSFELTGLPTGSFKVWARAEGYVGRASDPIAVREGETVRGIVVELSHGGGVDGFAVGEDGAPFAGGEASASRLGEGVGGLRSLGYMGHAGGRPIDAAGYFRIEGLEPGRYQVTAFPAEVPGEDWVKRTRRALRGMANAEEGKVTRVEFVRPKGGGTVKGRVRRGAEAAEGIRVSIAPRESGDGIPAGERLLQPLQATTGPDGAYEIPLVPPGKATLFVWSTAGASRQVETEVPMGGEVVADVALPTGEVAGRVTSAVDGSPVPRAHVMLVRDGEPSPDWPSRVSNAQTVDDGKYRIRDVPPGTYSARASIPGFARIDAKHAELGPERAGPVAVGDGPAALDFALSPGARALVTVRLPDGKPAIGASVEVRTTRDPAFPGALRAERDGLTDEEGVARIVGLPRVEAFVVARLEGFAAGVSEERSLRGGEETEVRVELREGTRVRVKALAPDGSPVKNAHVQFTDARGVSHFAGREREPRPEDRGFLVARFLPGEVQLQTQANGFVAATTRIVVGPASPQDVVVRLERQPEADR